MVVVPLLGCSRKQDSAAENEAPIAPLRPLVASMQCLTKPLPSDETVPWDAALTLAEISGFAYSDAQLQGAQLRALGATDVRPIVNGSSHGVVASNDKVVVVAFRGTKDPVDWLTDANIIGKRVAEGRMHGGFYDATNAIFDRAYDEAVRQGAKHKVVWITGHSLGGAMAMAFAYRAFTDKNLEPAGIITFGQPLTVTTPLAQFMLDTFKSRYMRFVNNRDPVTRLVPAFRHAGARIHLTEDDYTFRQPMIAFSAPADAKGDAPVHVLFHEDDPSLEPMTEDEYQSFQKQLSAEHNPPLAPDGRLLMRGSLPLLTPHYIATYIDRLKKIGQKHVQ
jgi:Lipase (class 3)